MTTPPEGESPPVAAENDETTTAAETANTGTAADVSPTDRGGGGGPIDIDDLIHWVHATLLPGIQRPLRGGITWCPKWWEHVEAVVRFEAIRRSWEGAVTSDEPDAMSNWLIYVVDAHMRELLSPTGTFSDCGYSDREGWPQPHRPKALPMLDPEDFDHSRYASRTRANAANPNVGGAPPGGPDSPGGGRGHARRNRTAKRNGASAPAQRGRQLGRKR